MNFQDLFLFKFFYFKEVTENDINSLCISILDGAKKPFLNENKENENICIPSYSVLKKYEKSNQKLNEVSPTTRRLYESDESEDDSSMVSSHNSVLSGFLPTGKGINLTKTYQSFMFGKLFWESFK